MRSVRRTLPAAHARVPGAPSETCCLAQGRMVVLKYLSLQKDGEAEGKGVKEIDAFAALYTRFSWLFDCSCLENQQAGGITD